MRRKAYVVFLAQLLASVASAETSPWDMEALSTPPAMQPAAGFEADGVRAIFYDGLPYEGKPTRVFAWYGVPNPLPNGRLPAMVLVHGGGGTAFAEWVRLWTSRGYAAIAMDTCGQLPRGEYGKWERDPQGGPPGWGGLDMIEKPIEDQWTYHAVADVILAHTLIRSFPEVNADRIGLTGISWGGYLTCIAAGVDERFKLAAPVYGCGFLGENSVWVEQLAKLPKESADKWLRLWDPSVNLPDAKMPMLWVTGTNDFAFPLDSLQKSYRLPQAPRTLAIRLRMPHGHGGAGENPEEIHAFANSILRDGEALPRVTRQGEDEGKAWAKFNRGASIANAELLYTKASGKWQDRLWETAPATVDLKKRKAAAAIPEGTTVYFINLFDEQGRVVSAEHVEVQ